MRYALFFRQMKNTKYSFIPLLASLEQTELLDEIDVIFLRNMHDLRHYDGQYRELVVAFSFMTFDLDCIVEDLAALRNLPLRTPVRIVAGGPHVSGDAASGERLGFDSLFLGDGEETIRQFCRDLLTGTVKPVYDGTVHPVDLRDYPPFPTLKRQLIIPIEISRGCPHGCRYCAVSYLYGRKTRHRSIEQILHYSRWAVERGKTLTRFITPNAFAFQSENGVTPNLDGLEALLSGLRNAGMKEIYFGTFPSDVRPESVTRDVLQLVRRYCANENLVIGVQSGSSRMLDAMGRGHTLDQAEEAICFTREFQLEPWVDFIFGLPGETAEDRAASMAWMEKINARYGAVIHAHTFMPLVGTPWVDLDPHPIDDELRQLLGRFSQQNQMFGYWTRQRKLAEQIRSWRERGLISRSGEKP